MNPADATRILEAALLCAPEPLSLRELARLFEAAAPADSAPAEPPADVLAQLPAWLQQLQQQWAGRGLELVCVASGWCFQSRAELRPVLQRLQPESAPKYSRAALETLAIIAYRQPVTRGEMEDLRGVTIHSALLKQLEERGWIEVVGQRHSPGRPALYATTRQFLDDLGLPDLAALPERPPGPAAAKLSAQSAAPAANNPATNPTANLVLPEPQATF